MSYYFTTIIDGEFDAVAEKTVNALKEESFGILTEIDVRKALKEKLNVDFGNYRILGACNPPYAYRALQAENKIGTMLPCNVVVRETADGRIEVAAIDPIALMQAVDNPSLGEIALEIQQKLKKVIMGL